MYRLLLVAYKGLVMSIPDISKEKDPGLQMLRRLAATAVLWAATLIAANRTIDADPSRTIRILAVLVGVAGVLPWIWMAARAMVKQDEFTQRIHFVAVAWAFAVTGVFVYATDLSTKAHLVDYVSYTTIWLVMVVTWWLSILLTARYYR